MVSVFFFFKQKTAYEMRISDWSSDVCSSDLLLADSSVTEVMLNGRGDVWAERGGRLERLALDLDEREVEVLVERVVAPLGLRVDRTSPIEIGRASCRERVFQYV